MIRKFINFIMLCLILMLGFTGCKADDAELLPGNSSTNLVFQPASPTSFASTNEPYQKHWTTSAIEPTASVTAFQTHAKTPLSTPNPTAVMTTPAHNTLKGEITAFTSADMTVKDAKGNIYIFKRDDSLIKPGGAEIKAGCLITITYTGNIIKSQKAQSVKIISCYIECSDEQQDSNKPKDAYSLLKSLSIEEKVGQIFLVRCPQSNAAKIAANYKFGGYTLYGRDFKGYSKTQVVSNIQSYQNVSKIPMLIAVDEEGGKVTRVSSYSEFRSEPFLSPRDLYNKGGWPLVKSDTKEKCELLKSLGINLNLAPVCDVSVDPADYMYARSFGVNAELTSMYIKTVVGIMRQNNMGCALKHFPGYGNNSDTHAGIAIDERSLDEFRKNDFMPFKSGIDSGAQIVLVSHNIVKAMDPERPASLSKAVHEILRNELGFKGIIMTDDLYMNAIQDYTGGEEAAVMAVLAGNDLICCTDYETQYNAVLDAVKKGKITESRIDESVLRILQYKFSAGLIK